MYMKTMTFYIFYRSSSHYTALSPCYYLYIAVMPFPIPYKTRHTFMVQDVLSFGRTKLFSAQQVLQAKIVVPVSLFPARPFHLLVSD